MLARYSVTVAAAEAESAEAQRRLDAELEAEKRRAEVNKKYLMKLETLKLGS